MDCNEVAGRLFACEDGELSRTEMAGIGEHLSGCESCRALFESQVAVRERLEILFDEPVETPAIAAAVMAALPQPRRSLVTRWKWALAAAALAGVIVCGSLAYRTRGIEVVKAPKHQQQTPRIPAIKPVHVAMQPKPVKDDAVFHKPERRIPVGQGISVVRHSVAQRPPAHTVALKTPVVRDQPREVATSEQVVGIERNAVVLPSGELISTIRTTLMMPNGECCSRVTTSIGPAGTALTQTEDTMITQLQPIAGADSIDRPPLQTAAVQLASGGGG